MKKVKVVNALHIEAEAGRIEKENTANRQSEFKVLKLAVTSLFRLGRL